MAIKPMYRQPTARPKNTVVIVDRSVLDKTSADYARMRRNPVKMCVRCEQIKTNDRAHFATGRNGVLTSTCLACWRPDQQPPATRLEACHVCGTMARLVNDQGPQVENESARQGAPAPRLCRRCLLLVNNMLGLEPRAVRRLLEYVAWRDALRFRRT